MSIITPVPADGDKVVLVLNNRNNWLWQAVGDWVVFYSARVTIIILCVSFSTPKWSLVF